jgi:hypothetical protein
MISPDTKSPDSMTDNPLVPAHCRMRVVDRDLIRGGHYGQRSCEPHLQAEHMVCTDQSAYVKKALASPEPSTHGTKLTCHPVQRMSADEGHRTTTPPGTKAKTGRSSDSLTREKRYDFRYVATALLTTALMTGVASAQTTTTNKADASSTSATMHKEG